MHLADINGNGYLDIVTSDQRGYLAIHHGGPDGFSPDRIGKTRMVTDQTLVVDRAGGSKKALP